MTGGDAITCAEPVQRDDRPDGGGMRERIRRFDWSATPLGPIEAWPAALRLYLDLCLDAKFPMALYWGESLTLLYNDAWAVPLGRKHPWALGRPAAEVWSEIWDVLGNYFRRVIETGEALTGHDERFVTERHGYVEECYFDYTISAVRDEAGRMAGLFNAVIETTYRVLAERRARLLRDLAEAIAPAGSASEACRLAARALDAGVADLPFCRLYLIDEDHRRADAAGSAGPVPESLELAASIDLLDRTATAPWALAALSGRLERLEDPAAPGGACVPGKPAVIVPIALTLPALQPAGYLIAGLNPCLSFDEAYRAFIEAVAGRIAAAVAACRAREAELQRAVDRAAFQRALDRAALHESESRFRDYAAIASDWLWETDAEHRLSFLSEPSDKLHSPRRLIGLTRWERAADLAEEPEKWRRHLETLERREPFRDFVYKAIAQSGPPRFVSTSGKPIFDPAGKFLGYRGVGSDVTEKIMAERVLREAKEQAVAASRSKSAFLAHMSHELRTPLNAIIGMSEIIELEMFGPVGTARYRSYAADIHSTGLHLLDIINEILDMAKIEAGRIELEKRPLALDAISEAVLRILAGQVEAAGLAAAVEAAPDLPPVMADEPAIRRILFNLLSNAIKFTPRGGRIRVMVCAAGDGLAELTVADTGIGIEPEQIPLLMQPFAQIENVYRRKYAGAGLGLALVRSLVELHGGSIGIESQPGRGTAVTVRLPIAAPSEPGKG